MKERVATSNRYGQQTVHGSSALKYVEKSRDDSYVGAQQRKFNPLKQRLKEEKAKINIMCTFVNAFVIIATLAICVVFLKTQFNYNELNKEIELKKQELSSLKKENMQTQDDIKGQIDLEYVYNEATTRLGMHLPGPGDVYMIQVDPLTYTTKYASVEVKDDEITVGNVLGYITRGW